jgi:hypothetical protein
MTDARALQAVARIERALERIEATAARPATPPPVPIRDEAELVRLREVHQTLRSKVEDAIGQIDRLLETEAA